MCRRLCKQRACDGYGRFESFYTVNEIEGVFFSRKYLLNELFVQVFSLRSSYLHMFFSYVSCPPSVFLLPKAAHAGSTDAALQLGRSFMVGQPPVVPKPNQRKAFECVNLFMSSCFQEGIE